MDSIKRYSMVLLSIAAVIGGLVLFSSYFNFDPLFVWLQDPRLVRALLGILVLGYGLIGFGWFLRTKGEEPSMHKHKG